MGQTPTVCKIHADGTIEDASDLNLLEAEQYIHEDLTHFDANMDGPTEDESGKRWIAVLRVEWVEWADDDEDSMDEINFPLAKDGEPPLPGSMI